MQDTGSLLVLHPALIFIIGGLLLSLTWGKVRSCLLVLTPLLSLLQFLTLGSDINISFQLLNYNISWLRIDGLSYVFTIAFHFAAIVAAIYSLHLKDKVQDVTGLLYMGGAIGACLAGDLFSLFVWWELTAISSVFLIWASRTEASYKAGLRYLLIQVCSGVLLATGAIVYFHSNADLSFNHIGLDSAAGPWLFIAFGIKAAFPLLHNWLQDAYPKATVTGTVVLSAFTTKLAIYALARGFAGEAILIWIGCVMALFPVIYAVIENDLRKMLSYSLNNQLGYMVVAVGIGTELALNGAAAHALAHIAYKSLLFMSIGAMLYRTGTAKATELGGLYKAMPLTALFCLIGSLSASAFPLLSSFVTKSMIMSAAAEQQLWAVYLCLLIAAVGVMDHAGIRIPLFSFFGKEKTHHAGAKEAPGNMLLAMGLCASICIGIGVYPIPLINILPYHVDYHAYSVSHVVTQLQLLLFTLLGFFILYKKGWYNQPVDASNLDSDWLYRKLLPTIGAAIGSTLSMLQDSKERFVNQNWGDFQSWMKQELGSRAPIGSSLNTGTSLLAIVALLGLISFISLFF